MSLYPQAPGSESDAILKRIEQSLENPSMGTRTAILDFSTRMVLFEFPEAAQSDGGAGIDGLGKHVSELMRALFDEITESMRNVDTVLRREPAASTTHQAHMQALGNFMQTMRFFTRKNMMQLVAKRVTTLRKAVQLLKSVSSIDKSAASESFASWEPLDIRNSSVALTKWSEDELLQLPFLEKIAGDPHLIDIARGFFDAEDVTDQLTRAVSSKFVDSHNLGVRLHDMLEAVTLHIRLHNAQALTMHCLQDIQGIVRGLSTASSLCGG